MKSAVGGREHRRLGLRQRLFLGKMREHPLGREAQVIGEVVSDHHGMVLMKTGIGGTRVVDLLFGE